jgi:hypothetical protein
MSDVKLLESEKVAAEAKAIVAESDRARWEPRLLELLVALRDDSSYHPEKNVAAVFPEMGGLRDKLLQAMDGPAWQQEERGRSAASEARRMLTLWGDPRDGAIAQRTYQESKWMLPAPVRLAGPTLDAALEKWRDYHFKREGVPDRNKRTANWLRVLAKTDSCAYVDHYVRYRYWAYSMLLSVRKEGKLWMVQSIAEGRHEDFDHRAQTR